MIIESIAMTAHKCCTIHVEQLLNIWLYYCHAQPIQQFLFIISNFIIISCIMIYITFTWLQYLLLFSSYTPVNCLVKNTNWNAIDLMQISNQQFSNCWREYGNWYCYWYREIIQCSFSFQLNLIQGSCRFTFIRSKIFVRHYNIMHTWKIRPLI